MKLAFLFPGQGARHVLSGLKLARTWPEGARLIQLATVPPERSRGVSVPSATSANALEANGGRALEATEVLQPVLTAICLSIHRALIRAGVMPSLVLGHSLGELVSYAAAGVISDEAAVKLAALRGALMAREAATHPGGLLAFQSLTVANATLAHGLQLAAVNAPDEVVVSGPESALRPVLALRSARRVPVSGAWHSEAMSGAVDEFRAALREVSVSDARVPIIRNSDGALGHSLEALADQLTRPVQFVAALQTAVAQGVDAFVTVGPGAVLRGLVRKNLGKSVRVHTTEDLRDFERTVSDLLSPSPPRGRGSG